MNEIITTLIASAFGTGGIAGVAALINLGGKHRQHKKIERLSETEKFFEDDETVKNSLIAARRLLATEIAANILIRNTFGRYLVLLVPLTAIYVYLFWVFLDWNESFQEFEVLRSLFIVCIVFVAYVMIWQIARQRGRRQRNLKFVLLSHLLSVEEILGESRVLPCGLKVEQDNQDDVKNPSDSTAQTQIR